MEISYFTYVFSRRWPVLLVVLTALIFAIARWKRHPKVSALTVGGLLLFQFQSIGFSSLFYFLPRLADQGWSWASIDNLSIVLDVCHDIFFAAAVGLLMTAIFVGRNPKAAGSEGNRVTPI
jgi:hypothetical protein